MFFPRIIIDEQNISINCDNFEGKGDMVIDAMCLGEPKASGPGGLIACQQWSLLCRGNAGNKNAANVGFSIAFTCLKS